MFSIFSMFSMSPCSLCFLHATPYGMAGFHNLWSPVLKILSEMELAPRYKLQDCFHRLHYSNCVTMLSVACMPIYIVREGQNAIGIPICFQNGWKICFLAPSACQFQLWMISANIFAIFCRLKKKSCEKSQVKGTFCLLLLDMIFMYSQGRAINFYFIISHSHSHMP